MNTEHINLLFNTGEHFIEKISQRYKSREKFHPRSTHITDPRRPPSLFLSLLPLLQSPTLHQLVFSKSRIKRNRFNLLNSNYVEIDFGELEEDKY